MFKISKINEFYLHNQSTHNIIFIERFNVMTFDLLVEHNHLLLNINQNMSGIKRGLSHDDIKNYHNTSNP